MTLLEEFYHFHHCDKPTPADVMDKWGVITCLHCGFGVVLEPWPGSGKETELDGMARKPAQGVLPFPTPCIEAQKPARIDRCAFQGYQ